MKNGKDRRRHLRVPLDLQVFLSTPQGTFTGKTADISERGLAVILFLEEPELGDKFDITLKTSEGHEIPVTCEKVWSGKYIIDEVIYNAFGVQFAEISASDREIIAEMVKAYYRD